MKIEDAVNQAREWIEALISKELQYITGRNTLIITDIDWQDNKIFVTRGQNNINVRFDRIEAVIKKLIDGLPVHVDTALRSGSNDRSVIETIIANFPPVGYMLPNKGRNKTKNKVIQWLNEEIHDLGETRNIGEEDFEHLSLSIIQYNNAQILPKSLLLLAGISGTGKTRFVRDQAKFSGQFNETYCLTSVRPDWHEPSDLLGYISRLNGTAEYITTDVLQFIANAWREIVDSGLTLDIQDTDGNGERLVVLGERDILNQVLPYWLCLDEMNLAPVEQYFADYLSVLETREWYWEGDSFTYSSDALLKPATIKEVANTDKLRSALGFTEAEYDELWKYICQYGLAIPFNLMVAGTVNMDETTHGFSRKVIDRALSFDFGAFFPNDYDEFFSPTSFHKRLSYPIWSHASKEEVDFEIESQTGEQIKAGDTTIQFLKVVNSVLKNTPFELAYRALNELLLSVISVYPKDELSLKAVWDDFIMCKVLPRIEGDIDKLTTSDGKEILAELSAVLEIQLAPIWNSTESDVSTMRPDLYREKTDVEGLSDKEKILRIPCRSKDKIEWMGQRLTNSSFTSFWP